MCDRDEATPHTDIDWSLNRRQFVAAGAAGAALAACAPAAAAGEGRALAEDMVDVDTRDGTMDAFFVRPASGRHPAVLMWPDIAGLRDAFKVMARRLAGQGYAVFVANPYYRAKPAPQFEDFAALRAEGFGAVQPWRDALTPDAVMHDASAVFAWVDRQPQVDAKSAAATCGYCMGGPFIVYTAAALPARIGAAASLHGAGLVKPDDPQSPHRLLAKTQARYLFAIGQNDDAKSPDDKTALRTAAQEAGLAAEIEVYPADHGWTVIDSPAYDRTAAERAWTRMTATFAQGIART